MVKDIARAHHSITLNQSPDMAYSLPSCEAINKIPAETIGLPVIFPPVSNVHLIRPVPISSPYAFPNSVPINTVSPAIVVGDVMLVCKS